jgi:hypothetical protein
MKRMFISGAAGLLLLATFVYAFADIARPKTSPSPEKFNKIVFHTGLTVVPDTKAYEARLQITQEELKSLREALAAVPANPSMMQRVAQSSTRTIMAGVFLFLSVSFAGVWLARAGQRRQSRGHKAIAAVLLCAGIIGAATVITRANAGPPGWYRWAGLPQALKDGKETSGGLDIEIVPEGNGMRLIIPTRRVNKPNGEE